ncbi:MAG: 16S rRNA (cytidine(1402)-2'-O)-methyltransferase, partial [Lachnospiraceae bacterium]|nr:16S rRNA (cytidine(1402)-2'-O)-methyltransferase [Lachnospiraceae bacterium]
IYEAPHRLVRTLDDLYSALGDRRLTVCKELTKRYENAFQTTLEEACRHYRKEEPRGEYVLVLEGRSRKDIEEEERHSWEEMSLQEHMEIYLRQGMDRKEAMKAVAKDRGLGKRDVYKMLLEEE